MESPVFLIKPVSSKETLEKSYDRLKYDLPVDRKYHFSMLLHKEWEMADIKPQIPTPEMNLKRIALFKQNSESYAEIEVVASLIPREVNPSDWLELWLSQNNANIVDGRMFQTDYGTVADFLSMIYEPGKNKVLRSIAIKDGNRIFALFGRAFENNYPDVAETFLLAVTSFELMYPTLERFAEDIIQVSVEKPVMAEFQFPASWVMKKDKYNSDDVYTISFYNHKGETVVGVFTYSAISKRIEESKESLLKNYLDNFTDNGFKILGEQKITPGEYGENTWQAMIQLNDKKGNDFEITAVFVDGGQAINMFSILSFIDPAHTDIHIINKRAHEMAIGTFKFN